MEQGRCSPGGWRRATGIPSGNTDLPALARALSVFNVSSAPLFAADAGSDDPLAAIRLAPAHGRPVDDAIAPATLLLLASSGLLLVALPGRQSPRPARRIEG